MKKKDRYKRDIIITVGVLIIVSAILWFPDISFGDPQVCVNEMCFNVEVADTDEEKIMGLSGRESLAEDAGMLFTFEQAGHHGFWMKGMNFPLDIVWIRDDGMIVSIARSLEPCVPEGDCRTYHPGEAVKYVLEVNGGSAERYGFSEGDFVERKG